MPSHTSLPMRTRIPWVAALRQPCGAWALRRERRVTRQVEANEAAVRASGEELKFALDAARMGIWQRDLVSGRLRWSDRCRAILAIPPDTVLTYDLFLEALFAEDRRLFEQAVSEAVSHRTDYDAEMRVPWPDGTVHWVAARGRALYDSAGKAVRLVGVVVDITERKPRRRSRRARSDSGSWQTGHP